MLQFDSAASPVAPRDAATVIVTRMGSTGLEVFCVKRHAKSGFLGGALVFPGGKVAEYDRDDAWEALVSPLNSRAQGFAEDLPTARAFAVAALRELAEEAALLPTTKAELSHDAALSLRRELAALSDEQDDSRAFAELLRRHDLIADASRLEPFARWITPAAEPRRYDTRFYVLTLTEAQSGRHDEHETTQSFWKTPREVLDAWEKGEFFLAPPTSRTLEVISGVETPEALHELSRQQSLEPICPHFSQDGELMVLALPGDPLYPEAMDPPPGDAPTRFVLENGRFLGRRGV